VKPFIAIACLCLLMIFSAPARSAAAQTRSRRTSASSQRRRAGGATPAASRLDQTRFNAQRLELAGLSKDLTRFLYLYGRLSKDLELTATQSESGDVAGRTKAGLIENVHAMRDRLDQLESHFRFAQGLERQYQTLQGVSGRADQAAQSVSANQFDRAGRILLDIANQLTDVLLDMQ
jgi:hypothetical protein